MNRLLLQQQTAHRTLPARGPHAERGAARQAAIDTKPGAEPAGTREDGAKPETFAQALRDKQGPSVRAEARKERRGGDADRPERPDRPSAADAKRDVDGANDGVRDPGKNGDADTSVSDKESADQRASEERSIEAQATDTPRTAGAEIPAPAAAVTPDDPAKIAPRGPDASETQHTPTVVGSGPQPAAQVGANATAKRPAEQPESTNNPTAAGEGRAVAVTRRSAAAQKQPSDQARVGAQKKGDAPAQTPVERSEVRAVRTSAPVDAGAEPPFEVGQDAIPETAPGATTCDPVTPPLQATKRPTGATITARKPATAAAADTSSVQSASERGDVDQASGEDEPRGERPAPTAVRSTASAGASGDGGIVAASANPQPAAADAAGTAARTIHVATPSAPATEASPLAPPATPEVNAARAESSPSPITPGAPQADLLARLTSPIGNTREPPPPQGASMNAEFQRALHAQVQRGVEQAATQAAATGAWAGGGAAGSASVLLRLHPANLGMLRVYLKMDGAGSSRPAAGEGAGSSSRSGGVKARFEVSSARAKGILDSSIEQLRGALRERGWHVGEVSVTEMAPLPGNPLEFAAASEPTGSRASSPAEPFWTPETASEFRSLAADRPFTVDAAGNVRVNALV